MGARSTSWLPRSILGPITQVRIYPDDIATFIALNFQWPTLWGWS
jgi:hypothetical protein